MAEQNPGVIGYSSSVHSRPRQSYAGFFVTAGAINLVIGFAYALGDGLGFLTAMMTPSPVIAAGIGLALFTVTIDGLFLVGSVSAFWRRPWSRQTLRISAGFQFLIVAISAVLLNLQGLLVWRGILRLVIVVHAFRSLHSIACWFVYGSTYAEVYFGHRGQGPYLREPVESDPAISLLRADESSAASTRPHPEKGRFRVRGIDAASGNSVEYLSKAATSELAKRSGISMGLDPLSIEVEPMAKE